MISPRKVADKYLALEASRWVIKTSPKSKIASIAGNEIDENILSVFGEGMLRYASIRKVSILKGLGRKLKEIYDAFQKAPDLWKKLKEMLGVVSTNQISLYYEFSEKFQGLLDDGERWWAGVKSEMEKDSKIIRFVFQYAANAPTLTSIVQSVIDRNGGGDGKLAKEMERIINPVLRKARNLSDWIGGFFDRHPLLNALTTPAKAYIYWSIWINVTELSWKITDLLKGFLGLISWSDLLKGLPESGIGFLVSLLFPGIPRGWISKSLSIGWNALLVPAVGLQLYFLYRKGLINGEGIPVHITLAVPKTGVEPVHSESGGF